MKVETSTPLKPNPFPNAVAKRSFSTLAKAPPAALLQGSGDSSRKSPFDMMKGISNDLDKGARYQGLKASQAKNRQAFQHVISGSVNKAYQIGKSDAARMSQAIEKRPTT